MHTPLACICHDTDATDPEISISRDLIRIRGAYRYSDRHTLDAALSELRTHLDGATVEPLSLRCWVTGPSTLRIDITVPMFSEHALAPRWCELLAGTALDADYDIRRRTF
jgi:hypothetical protein